VLGLLPSSHRKRVRLLWGSIAGAAVLVVASLIVFLPNTGHSTATPIDPSKAPARYHAPKTVRATAAEKAAALRTLGAFVQSAFIRRNLAASWPLATAHMKEGTSRSDWLAGDLPVVPYPANAYRTFGSTLKYQYKGVLGYDVLILPKETAAGRAAGQQVYACELHDVDGSWLVDFCYPRKTL
jgi:hypothetical protein